MILIRDTFHLKVGQMDRVLPAIKAMIAGNPDSMYSRILTDISGRHFTLVVESKAESVDAYWNQLQASFGSQDAERAAAFSELVEFGHREFYNIEHEA